MTATVEDTDLSTFEALAPPCEFPFTFTGDHWLAGYCNEAALWIVRWHSTLPCGCAKKNLFTLFADECWSALLVTGGRCAHCDEYRHTMDAVESVERI
jgi:hypothetical protein